MEKEQLVEELSKMTVLEMAELKTMLEDKWGVKAQAAAAAVVAAPVAGEGDGGEEATDFQVTLAEAPVEKKIAIIKAVRSVTGLGLKEAKDMVEGAPGVLKDSVPKGEAEEIKTKIAEAGGKVTLKGL